MTHRIIKQKRFSFITWAIATTTTTIIPFNISPVLAQIVPDNTLGSESSQVSPSVLINNVNLNVITGGATRGSNLFHSFSEFNVNNGQAAFFNNEAGINNILTRVTGGNPSNILGILAANGNANLFLINPNGIIFGENARLAVGGSFVGTTANSIKFADGLEFSAVNSSPSDLLTLSVPVGLQMGRESGKITSTENQLLGSENASLALIGSEINLDNSQLLSENGRIQLAALRPGTSGNLANVDLTVNGSDVRFKASENLARGNISLRNSFIFGFNGGAINIDANQLNLEESSRIFSTKTNGSSGGDIEIQAKDSLNLVGKSRIFSLSRDTATGTGGDINISAGNINIIGNGASNNNTNPNEIGSIIATETSGAGKGGDITLTATESIKLDNGQVSVASGGTGRSGNVTLRSGKNVNIINKGLLTLGTFGTGGTGDLLIETGNLLVENTFLGGGIGVNTNSFGRVGSISIRASNAVDVINGSINISSITPRSDSNSSNPTNNQTPVTAGDITIDTQRVNLKNGGYISTSTFSQVDAGNISIRADESIQISGISPQAANNSSVSSVTSLGASGNGGNINIQTPKLIVNQGGNISASSVQSSGDTGNINISTQDIEIDGFLFVPKEQLPDLKNASNPFRVKFSDSELQEVLSKFGGIGYNSAISLEIQGNTTDVRSGSVVIDTERLRLTNGGNISSSVVIGQGQGGNLIIRARDGIEISGVGSQRLDDSFAPSGLFADLQSRSVGTGGNINVTTGRLNMSNWGAISASTFSQGNAGKVDIRANQITMQRNSSIATQVNRDGVGNAGNINIQTQQLDLQSESQISSSIFGNGNGGNLQIEADTITLTGSNQPLVTGLTSAVDEQGRGDGGDMEIRTNRLIVRESAEISASNRGNGEAGNVNIAANYLEIDGKGSAIATVSDAGNGGDIKLDIRDVFLLRGGGFLSSTAGREQVGGDGGNIDINSQFIVAFPNENSDISANAYTGKGGNINIQTQGIFGIKPRPEATNQSDITASSQLGVQGQIAITEPDVDPSQGIIELPKQVIENGDRISKICPRTYEEALNIAQFTITGRGNLAPSPLEPLAGEINRQNLTMEIPLSTKREGTTNTKPNLQTLNQQDQPTANSNYQIIEAQGFIKTPNGQIKLVAQTPDIKNPDFCNFQGVGSRE